MGLGRKVAMSCQRLCPGGSWAIRRDAGVAGRLGSH